MYMHFVWTSLISATCISPHVIYFLPGWEEGEEGSRGERQRREGSRPDKWPPSGEWHGKHDAVWSGEAGQECDAGVIDYIFKILLFNHLNKDIFLQSLSYFWTVLSLFSCSPSLTTGLSLTNMTEMLHYLISSISSSSALGVKVSRSNLRYPTAWMVFMKTNVILYKSLNINISSVTNTSVFTRCGQWRNVPQHAELWDNPKNDRGIWWGNFLQYNLYFCHYRARVILYYI